MAGIAASSTGGAAHQHKADIKRRDARIIRLQKIFILELIVLATAGLVLLSFVLMKNLFYFNVFGYITKDESPLSVEIPSVNVDNSKLQTNIEARAVPVIFYHGVVEDSANDDINVTKSDFLSQMVTLKREGYYTIDTQEMIDFYGGKKKLYGKPILISFDDGRVDSYRPVDDILRQLNFRAVFFIVSGKQDNHTNPFFLSWDQLHTAEQSGRWDIQAHGWYSHTKIPIDNKGTTAPPLVNRMWLANENRLETTQEAEKRIENDYIQNLKDLRTQFPGHEIESFAVPFGDYGQHENNFPEAEQFNYDICKKYFKICFLIDSQGINFKEHDPLRTFRLEVKSGWSGELLLQYLDLYRARSPEYSVDYTRTTKVPVNSRLLGASSAESDGLRLVSRPNEDFVDYDLDARAAYNYRVDISYTHHKGTSAYLSGYKYSLAATSQNVLFGTTSDVAYLFITKNGQTTQLASQPLSNFDQYSRHTLSGVFKNGHFTGYLDGELVFDMDLPTIENRGTYGLDFYGPEGVDLTLHKVTVSTTNGQAQSRPVVGREIIPVLSY